MSAATTSGIPARMPWWSLLIVLAGAAATGLAWFAGQRADQAEAATSTASGAERARAGAPTGRASATVRNAPTRETSNNDLPDERQVEARAAVKYTDRLSPLPWPFWEYKLKQALPPRSPPLNPPPWRLIGATESGGAWSLVVLRQGRTAPEFFKVGDSLPGGSRVVAISQDEVTLDSGGRSVVLSFIGTR